MAAPVFINARVTVNVTKRYAFHQRGLRGPIRGLVRVIQSIATNSPSGKVKITADHKGLSAEVINDAGKTIHVIPFMAESQAVAAHLLATGVEEITFPKLIGPDDVAKVLNALCRQGLTGVENVVGRTNVTRKEEPDKAAFYQIAGFFRSFSRRRVLARVKLKGKGEITASLSEYDILRAGRPETLFIGLNFLLKGPIKTSFAPDDPVGLAQLKAISQAKQALLEAIAQGCKGVTVVDATEEFPVAQIPTQKGTYIKAPALRDFENSLTFHAIFKVDE